MKLSNNLSLAEVIKSTTAKRIGIDNMPNETQLKRLQLVAINVFQPLRNHFKRPIHVSSGFRGVELNKAIGGSLTSQHMLGEALDIDNDVYGKPTNMEIFLYIRENLPFDQLIYEAGTDRNPAWVHVSYTERYPNRGEVLRMKRVNGRSVYYQI